jgi:hypothetical protein
LQPQPNGQPSASKELSTYPSGDLYLLIRQNKRYQKDFPKYMQDLAEFFKLKKRIPTT